MNKEHCDFCDKVLNVEGDRHWWSIEINKISWDICNECEPIITKFLEGMKPTITNLLRGSN